MKFGWTDAVPLLRDSCEKPKTWLFRKAYEAMRQLEGNPVPANLTGAEQTLARPNPSRSTRPRKPDRHGPRPKKTLLESPDVEAAALAAIRLAEFRGFKCSPEKIETVRALGMELLGALAGEVTRPLLKRLAESFDDEWSRERFKEILNSLDMSDTSEGKAHR